jgi:aryl-alcohol dehydrogenase-like predicted oxidoreductase
MEYRRLGNSDLKISLLSLGTMTFGGQGNYEMVGNTGPADARRQMDICLDAGVNMIDTAEAYSSGLSEEIVGHAIHGRRDKVILATKVRPQKGGPVNHRRQPYHHIISSCEASLRRMKIDYIDLFQMHRWDGQTPLEETLEALAALETAGKVRYVGVCNYSSWQLMKALGLAGRAGQPRLVSQQIYYSLLAREAEYELIPAALDQNVGTLVWGPLAGGFLTGKYRNGEKPASHSRHLTDWGEPPVDDPERLDRLVGLLLTIGEHHRASPAQVALAYILGQPTVTSLIVGARTEEQLTENLGAMNIRLDATERNLLDEASAQRLLYPYWHQVKHSRDLLSKADLSLLGPYL